MPVASAQQAMAFLLYYVSKYVYLSKGMVFQGLFSFVNSSFAWSAITSK